MKTAFVFSGGGPRGFWQLIIVKRLMKEFGIVPDFITATSVGAANAALISHIGVELGIRFWETQIKKREDVWKYQLPDEGVFDPEPLSEKIASVVRPFQAKIPYVVTAVNAKTWALEYRDSRDHSNSDMARFVLQSTAIPALVEPVDGRYDGGVRCLTPLKKAIDMGADRIFAILCTPPTDIAQNFTARFPRLASHAANAIQIVLHQAMLNDLHICEVYNKYRPDKRFVHTQLIAPLDELPIGDAEFSSEKFKTLKQMAEEYPLSVEPMPSRDMRVDLKSN